MKKFNLKSKFVIIPSALLIIAIVVPSVRAYYFSKIDSNMTTTFKIEYDSVFIRAYVITYWEDPNTDEIVSKSSWNLKDGITSIEWTNIDGYYYYNGAFNRTEIEDGLPSGKELIDPTFTVDELSAEDLTDLIYTAKYKIVYEFIEASANENDELSCEEAWGITYLEDGSPSKIQ